jgi:hypothetical protein
MNSSRFQLLPRRVPTACLFAFAVLFSGCATTTTLPGRFHSDLNQRMGEIGTTAVLPPNITLNSLGAGGIAEKRDDWTDTARAHARAYLESKAARRIVYLADLPARQEFADELAEVQGLFRLIDLNLLLTYTPQMVVPPTAYQSFDFSVGSIDRICEAAGADALLLIGGVDDIFAADRKALAALALVAGAFTGVYMAPSSGEAHISAALIARDGTILWWNWVPGGIGDLRKPEGVQTTLDRLLSTLPLGTASKPPQ